MADCARRDTASGNEIVPGVGDSRTSSEVPNPLVESHASWAGVTCRTSVGDGPGHVRRQTIVGRHHGQQIGDDSDLSRGGEPCEAGKPMVLAADPVQQRSPFEERVNERVHLG